MFMNRSWSMCRRFFIVPCFVNYINFHRFKQNYLLIQYEKNKKQIDNVVYPLPNESKNN